MNKIIIRRFSFKHCKLNEDSPNKVVSFYDEVVNEYASKPIQSVKFKDLIQFGTPPLSIEKLINSAQYTLKDLPIRLAKRVQSFQNLPYIVGLNPHIIKVYRLYYESFQRIIKFKEIRNEQEDINFTNELKNLVEEHKNVIPILSKGFLECENYLSKEQIKTFLDRSIHSRIGIRIIAEQHIALHDPISNYIGILHTNLKLRELIEYVNNQVQDLFTLNYDLTCKIKIIDKLDTTIQYIPVHLEYILMELLKNSYRSSIENYINKKSKELKPIEILISKNEKLSCIKISDFGGGINPKFFKKIFEYNFTTVKKDSDDNIFDFQAKNDVQNLIGGPIAGLGYGLPMARIYAEYFGGSLQIETMSGLGTDAYIFLKNTKDEIFSTEIV